jgi:hypothetical protein
MHIMQTIFTIAKKELYRPFSKHHGDLDSYCKFSMAMSVLLD